MLAVVLIRGRLRGYQIRSLMYCAASRDMLGCVQYPNVVLIRGRLRSYQIRSLMFSLHEFSLMNSRMSSFALRRAQINYTESLNTQRGTRAAQIFSKQVCGKYCLCRVLGMEITQLKAFRTDKFIRAAHRLDDYQAIA